jgi:hypothetical protein
MVGYDLKVWHCILVIVDRTSISRFYNLTIQVIALGSIYFSNLNLILCATGLVAMHADSNTKLIFC